MGIVNVNDDSFSGDGTLVIDDAVDQAVRLVCEGADMIDVGAESARTNRQAIPPEEEVRRFRAFLERWAEIAGRAKPRDEDQVWPPVLSANTWRPEVVDGILPDSAIELLNDMSGLPDDRNVRSCARAGVALLVMHTVGEPKKPHFHVGWDDVMGSLEKFFEERIERCLDAGLDETSLVLDPGIDFAKQRNDNLTVFRKLSRLTRFRRPILVPVSRKTVIGEVLGLADPRDRDAGTIACLASSAARGGSIFRVHHVDAAWQALRVLAALG